MALRLNVVLFWIRTSIHNFPENRPSAFPNWLVYQRFRANPSLAKNRKCGIDTDSREPCRKARSSVEISKMDKGVKNRLLESILGIFSILCNSGEDEQNTSGVTIAKVSRTPP